MKTIRESITESFLSTIANEKDVVVADLKFEQLEDGLDSEGDMTYILTPIIHIERKK